MTGMTQSGRRTRHLTDEEVRQKLALKRDVRYSQEGVKWQLALVGGLLSGPFVSLFVLMSFWEVETSAWPVVPFLLLNLTWCLVPVIGHRSMSLEERQRLSPPEQERRLAYDSFWMRLWQGGFGLFTSGMLLWGLVKILLIYNSGFYAIPFTALYLGILIFICVRRTWATRVTVEGTKFHPWLKPFLTLLLSLAVGAPLLGGLTRLVVVTQGQASAVQILGPFILVLLWLLSVVVGFFGILALWIAGLQYQEWKT